MAYTIQLLDITEVSLNDNNPRFIKDKSFKDLVKSLKECPALFDARPLLCNADRVILGGNMRYRAALELRYTEVPVIIMEGLTPEQEREIVIKDNGGFGSWDFEALANGWSDLPLDEWGVDLPEGWLAEPEEAPEEEEFNADPPKEPITVLGDLYELNGHRLHCADSTDSDAVAKLMDGKLADMVFTDPPYGVSFQSGMSKGGTATRFEVLENDDTILDIAPVVWLFMKDNTAAFIWTSHHVYQQWREQFNEYYKQTVIWYKHGGGIGDLTGSYALDYEMALFCVKGRPLLRGHRGAAVWDIGKDAALEYQHPTQKPTALSERAIADFSDKNATVLDLFVGSGSTLIGCEKTNRTCYGQELGENYCDVIVRRWVKYMQDNNRPYTVKRNGQELSKAEIDQFFEA